MSKFLMIALIVIGVIVVVLFVGINWYTRGLAIDTCTMDDDELPDMEEDPADYGMDFEDVSVTTEDGFNLTGWFVPSKNGATIMAMHGSPGGRQDTLFEAEFLTRHGYGVLMPSFRAHDDSDGDRISFGYHERKDMDAWYSYLLSRDDVDPEKIGAFGESMGGGTTILYSAENQEIKAVATASAFALTPEMVEYFIVDETGLPSWLASILARFITFWADRECDVITAEIDTQKVVGDISPRPILIIHGGQDNRVSPNSGHELYAAALEPKELWFVEEAGHVNFDEVAPEEYEERVVRFFDRYLLNEE